MITEKARLLLDIWPRWFDEPKGSIMAKHSLFFGYHAFTGRYCCQGGLPFVVAVET